MIRHINNKFKKGEEEEIFKLEIRSVNQRRWKEETEGTLKHESQSDNNKTIPPFVLLFSNELHELCSPQIERPITMVEEGMGGRSWKVQNILN